MLLVVFNLVFPQNASLKEIDPKINQNSGNLQQTIYNQEDYRFLINQKSLPEAKDKKPRKIMYLTVTAYSSSRDETDGDPFTTASGEKVKDGIIAHNLLPFGTKVRFPEVFGGKIFTVEDRLNPRHGQYIADIWMPSKQLAKQWGAKVLKMEIL